MKVSAGTAVVAATLVLLSSGCATTSETAYAPSANSTSPETRLSNDELYMARVEAIARRRGIDLTWVNPPRKLVAKEE